jgi:hypothetical protein
MKLYKLIYEAEEFERPELDGFDVEVGSKTKLAKDSLDDQIDSLLLKFSSLSIIDKEDEDQVNETVSLYSLLYEVEEDVIDPAAEEADNPQGSEEVEVDEEADQPKPKIDIDKFALRVADLVKNYESVLKPEMAIVNRAIKFLEDNENEEHKLRFLDILENQHDIRVKKYNRQGDDVGIDVPQGVGAYDAGSGAGGG